jgi:hypothetical protein
MAARNGTLWDTHVSHGVYEALFNYYPDPKFVPYGEYYSTMTGAPMAEAISDHILGSFADTKLLNPTVMIHTTVSPELLRSLTSFARANWFHGLGTFPRSILRLLLPYGDGPSSRQHSRLRKLLHRRPVHLREPPRRAQRLGIRRPHRDERTTARTRLEDGQRGGYRDDGPTRFPLGRKVYPSRCGVADLPHTGAAQAPQ